MKFVICYFLIDFTPFKTVNPLRDKLLVGVKELETKVREQKEYSGRQWIDFPVTYLNIKVGMEARRSKGVPHARIVRKESVSIYFTVTCSQIKSKLIKF